MGRKLLSIAVGTLLLTAPAFAQEKGGEDETGAYEVVANWPQPWSPAGYIWGSQPAVFAQSPDRIFIGVRGEVANDARLNLRVITPTAFEQVNPAKVGDKVAAQIVPPSLLPGARTAEPTGTAGAGDE